MNISKTQKLVEEWAWECGEILNKELRKSLKKPLKIVDKGKFGLATEADLKSEAHVIGKIKKHFPDHQILSEEDSFNTGLERGFREGEYLWLIDPLDGTNNFYNKLPFFCISLALYFEGRPLIGVVYNPVSGELFSAQVGKGAFYTRVIGDQRIRVKLSPQKEKNLRECLLSANTRKLAPQTLDNFAQLRAMRRMGSAALELCYVAAGLLDGYWEKGLKPWDMAAAALICQEAGAMITQQNGEAFDPFAKTVLASQTFIYEEIRKLI